MLSGRSITNALSAFALAVAALLSIAGPGAVASPTDARSPDAQQAAAAATQQPVVVSHVGTSAQDLRSPDAQSSTAVRGRVVRAADWQDLRSPDGTDAVRRPVPAARVIQIKPDNFDWTDAAIGAGGAVGLALILVGGTAVVMRRRGGDRGTRPAIS